MELTFGTEQVYTSRRMQSSPVLAKAFLKCFGYSNIGNYARFQVFRKIIRKTILNPNSKIMDLGTGYGEYSFSLARALPNADIHAIDIDEERINTVNRAKVRSDIDNITTHCEPIERVGESQFDFIFSIDVFEHIYEEEMPFATAFEKLKPGGSLLVKIPNKHQKTLLPASWFEEHHEWLEEEHVGQVYNLSGLVRRFLKEGFLIESASYSDGWLARLGWEIAYLGKKMGTLGQLLTIPPSKFLIHLDNLIHHKTWGNAIQVIGRKP